MSDPKILFLDIDFTLLDDKGAVSPQNADALRRAREAGHQIVICSGRPLCCITPVAGKLGLAGAGCYVIAYNGALIYDCGKKSTLFEERLPFPLLRVLFDKADEHGLYIHTYGEDCLLIRSRCEESDYYIGRTGIRSEVMPDLPGGMVKEPVKALLIDLHDKSRLERYREDVGPLLEGKVSLFFSSSVLLECVKAGITKGTAVNWLCRHLGIPMEHSVAAGDSENDIPMLEAAHVGCAMANATTACKDAADYITARDCNHSGVAEIIEKFLL